ncbi:metalloregulator ArsR/SmtB family transcription factor [Microbulbifer yueqingensis]|uniref:Transcriptional regulator, ArsR family n=1 Tax=Microbulbifer yueqingensis TaxID=658219 RepID=A0A1G8ZXJ8_9GAMM|nr:metalloregulator ArsR/SmtB family transcription factor [Microbulbifer yueqingensis]SDK19773.1 transcriptional regulator, ArsR family [Microbulbifer yueqingensis]
MTPLQFFKALADDTRLRCLLLISSEGELCVCELVSALAESQPKISRHLAALRQAGLLRDRRQGQWVFYRIDPALPEWARAVLRQTLQADNGVTADDLERLQRMGSRPDRCVPNE